MNFTAIKTQFLGMIATLEAGVKAAWGEFCHIVYTVFQAEEQAVMAQLTPILKNIAIDLQNATPGMDSKTFFLALEGEAVKAVASLGKVLAWTAVATTVSTVLHDLNVPDTAGNAGVLTGGNQTTPAA